MYDSEECFSVHALFVWILAATVSSRLERMMESGMAEEGEAAVGVKCCE